MVANDRSFAAAAAAAHAAIYTIVQYMHHVLVHMHGDVGDWKVWQMVLVELPCHVFRIIFCAVEVQLASCTIELCLIRCLNACHDDLMDIPKGAMACDRTRRPWGMRKNAMANVAQPWWSFPFHLAYPVWQCLVQAFPFLVGLTHPCCLVGLDLLPRLVGSTHPFHSAMRPQFNSSIHSAFPFWVSIRIFCHFFLFVCLHSAFEFFVVARDVTHLLLFCPRSIVDCLPFEIAFLWNRHRIVEKHCWEAAQATTLIVNAAGLWPNHFTT
jgi:hypothetical protein